MYIYDLFTVYHQELKFYTKIIIKHLHIMIWKEFQGYQIFLLYLSNMATTLVVHELRFKL